MFFDMARSACLRRDADADKKRMAATMPHILISINNKNKQKT